ncbi:hypothetical protein Bca4012_101320 [Brassica carinata]
MNERTELRKISRTFKLGYSGSSTPFSTCQGSRELFLQSRDAGDDSVRWTCFSGVATRLRWLGCGEEEPSTPSSLDFDGVLSSRRVWVTFFWRCHLKLSGSACGVPGEVARGVVYALASSLGISASFLPSLITALLCGLFILQKCTFWWRSLWVLFSMVGSLDSHRLATC